MKSKFVFGLVAVMVVLALAPSSFAQVNVQIFNTSSPQEVKTNRTAETSDPLSSGAGITVSGSLVAASNLSTTNLILTFPSVITVGANSQENIPSGDPIRIVAATGIFAGATIVTRNGANLTISLIGAADIVGNTNSGSFRVVGTRIDANGLATPANGTASLSSSANNFILSSTSFPVISSTGDGIASIAQDVITAPNGGAITIFTNRQNVNSNTTVLITEGFNFAWRSAAQNQIDAPGAAGVGATEIRLTVNGIPSTVTLTITTSGTSGFTTSNLTRTTLTSSNNVVVFTVGNTKPDAVDKLQVNLSASTPTSNPSIGSITATATMYPLGDALNTNGTLVTSITTGAGGANDIHVVPRFVAAEVGPATIGNIIAASTTLLIPYAVKLAGFDTGIAIANTTADPFGVNGGSATPTAGTLTLDFFPRTATGAGTSFSLTTSATVRPGIGLSTTDGTLAAGGLWSALLSEILTAVGQTGDFSGYIFVRTNFLLAHGAAFISDFRGFTSATPVNVLTPPAFAPRNVLIESLNQ